MPERISSPFDITFHPDGGDLGRAQRQHSILEFAFAAPHIVHIFQNLYEMGVSRLPFKYAFEFSVTDRHELEMAMKMIQFPKNVSYYETDGRALFEMRGPSGGVTTRLICYIITHD